jgi:hypothetical protein
MNRLADMAIEGAPAKVAPVRVKLTLTWTELSFAMQTGVRARLDCIRRDARPRYGAAEGEAGFELGMFSAPGEMAVAKYLNLYWSGANGIYGAVDVGGERGVEVRTRSKHRYELPLHDDDEDSFAHVLVTCEDPRELWLVGWIYGRDGKLQKYWKDPAGGGVTAAYFIPHCDLRPIAELKEIIGGPAYIEKNGAGNGR